MIGKTEGKARKKKQTRPLWMPGNAEGCFPSFSFLLSASASHGADREFVNGEITTKFSLASALCVHLSFLEPQFARVTSYPALSAHLPPTPPGRFVADRKEAEEKANVIPNRSRRVRLPV